MARMCWLSSTSNTRSVSNPPDIHSLPIWGFFPGQKDTPTDRTSAPNGLPNPYKSANHKTLFHARGRGRSDHQTRVEITIPATSCASTDVRTGGTPLHAHRDRWAEVGPRGRPAFTSMRDWCRYMLISPCPWSIRGEAAVEIEVGLGQDHEARRRGVDGRADGGGEIDAVMGRLGLPVQHPLHAEGRGSHRVVQGQDEAALEIRRSRRGKRRPWLSAGYRLFLAR